MALGYAVAPKSLTGYNMWEHQRGPPLSSCVTVRFIAGRSHWKLTNSECEGSRLSF